MKLRQEVGKGTRRQFIQRACTIAGITILPSQYLLVSDLADDFEHDTLKPLIDVLVRHDLAIRVGREYLQAASRKETKTELTHWLGARIGVASEKHESIFNLIETSIRDDFSENNISIVQGWWLSETEVRMCAVAALTAAELKNIV